MKVRYYRVSGVVNAIVSSLDFICYVPQTNSMLHCREPYAQYVQVGDNFYRIIWFRAEDKSQIGKYPTVQLSFATPEEEEEYKKEGTVILLE